MHSVCLCSATYPTLLGGTKTFLHYKYLNVFIFHFILLPFQALTSQNLQIPFIFFMRKIKNGFFIFVKTSNSSCFIH